MQEASAKQTYIIMSPRKLRRIANEVRRKNALKAYNMLRLMPYSAARVILKKLIEASHNAQVKFGVGPQDLEISDIQVDEGPAYRRFKPRAQGRIYRREKPTSHITIRLRVVGQEKQEKQPKKAAAPKKQKKAKAENAGV